MSKVYNDSTKRRILSELSRSESSISAFSQSKGIAESTLWKWRKAAEKAGSGDFIELGGSAEQYEISSKGVTLKIPSTESLGRIAEIFKALAC